MGENFFCTKCGNTLKPGMKFCNVCGKAVISVPQTENPANVQTEKISLEKAPENAAPAVSSMNVQPAAAPVAAQENAAPKSVTETVQMQSQPAVPVTPVITAATATPVATAAPAATATPVATAVTVASAAPATPEVPAANRPVGMWGYFGLKLLLCIPVVGFILTFVLAFAPKNVNIKNFVRSRFCEWIILSVPFIIFILFMLITGTTVTGLLQGALDGALGSGALRQLMRQLFSSLYF